MEKKNLPIGIQDFQILRTGNCIYVDKTELIHRLITEGYYYLGIYIKSEVHSSNGRADSVVETPTHIYIFEFKYNRSGKAAMDQLKRNNYADPYRTSGKTIVGIGVNFSHITRKINGWKVEIL